MKSISRKVDSFDGQTITLDGKPGYELGGFLGGGAAGVVYEGVDVSENSHVQPVAIKILNPIGFRLAPEDTMRRCVVARRGRLPSGYVENGTTYSAKTAGGVLVGDLKSTGTSAFPSASGGIGGGGAGTGVGSGNNSAGGSSRCQNEATNALGPEHVWWLVSPNTKQILAAYIDPRYGNLVELPLPKCIEIWGYNPRTDFSGDGAGGSGGGDSSRPSGSIAVSTSSCVSPNRACCPSSSTSVSSSTCLSSRGGCRPGESQDGSLEKDSKKEGRSSCSGGGLSDHRDGICLLCSTTDMNRRIPAAGPHGGPSAAYGTGGVEVQVDGMGVAIPWVPPKFVQWLAQRKKVRREICNMTRVGNHRNVVKLLSVLELLQDSKSTLFLILELVAGGELLDHIRPMAESNGGGAGSRSGGRAGASALRAEGSVQRYFGQLLSGLSHCHRQGVCHRDLSPSNLLLAESSQRDASPELKIADFGLSACCAMSSGNENQGSEHTQSEQKMPLRVTSIVGSPHYMAPEVYAGNANDFIRDDVIERDWTGTGSEGYDGFKADAWSSGVVLYTMLTASLPFGRELARCPRYKRWRKWTEKNRIGAKRHPFTNSSSSTTPMGGVPSSADAAFLSSTPSGRIGATGPSATGDGPASSSAGSSSAAATAAVGVMNPSSPPAPPQWLFPPSLIPVHAKSLLVALLTPDPSRRMTVEQAAKHPWVAGGECWTPGSPQHHAALTTPCTGDAGKQQPSNSGSPLDCAAVGAGLAGTGTGVGGSDSASKGSSVTVNHTAIPSTQKLVEAADGTAGGVGSGGRGAAVAGVGGRSRAVGNNGGRRAFVTEWKLPWEKAAAAAASGRLGQQTGGGLTAEGAFDVSFVPTTSFP